MFRRREVGFLSLIAPSAGNPPAARIDCRKQQRRRAAGGFRDIGQNRYFV